VDCTMNCPVHEWKVLYIGELITPNGTNDSKVALNVEM
jgi:hypothetical protein